MTLYRATKQEFLEDIDNGKDVTGFVSLMKDFYLSESGKEAGAKEIKSWYTSLPAMARVLQLSHIPADTQVYIEYEIPRAVSKRHIDFMLAGKDSEGDDAVVVVELKAWQWKYAGWKKPRIPGQGLLQARPVEPRTRVGLAPGGDVLVSGDVGDGVAPGEVGAQRGQCTVLARLESLAFEPLQFDAHGVVVALAASTVTGGTRMPGTLVAVDKLPQRPVAFDEKVGRYFQAADALEVGMGIPVQAVHEQVLHGLAAVFPWRQADGMHHDQVHAGLRGPGAEVGRCHVARPAVPALHPGGMAGRLRVLRRHAGRRWVR